MDISSLHNPYDFANPVSDENLFVGRKDELEEIVYYLDQAKTAMQPINLAIIGERASGKTSLLNMTEIEATKRDFCSVRIDLDEGDVDNQLGFFFAVFDELLTAACNEGSYGGLNGITYRKYRDLVDTFQPATNDLDEDKLFYPFLFPLQYARAMFSGNTGGQVSKAGFKADLVNICNEVGKPIVLMFDESNVLTKQRVLLEKLRNVFMNIQGYMLILTGTNDLFPIISEVFSPIIRQFKKVTVTSFRNPEDTRECIEKPLRSVGLSPEDILDRETHHIDIHQLSDGRPYEIQLICHMLFRRVQERRATRMELDTGVLDEIKKEIETSQEIKERPILIKIRELDKELLSALQWLCGCEGNASFEQVWSLYHLFFGKPAGTKEQLSKDLESLVSLGVLTIENDNIVFLGDVYDKIYAKYYARERNVLLSFVDVPLEIHVDIHWTIAVGSTSDIEFFSVPPLTDSESILTSITKSISNIDDESDPFVESPRIAEGIYRAMIIHRASEKTFFLKAILTFPWRSFQWYHYAVVPTINEKLEETIKSVRPLQDRATEANAELIVSVEAVPTLSVDTLAQRIEGTANERLKQDLFFYHLDEMRDNYLGNRDSDEALFHARLAYRYDKEPAPTACNDLGYLFMGAGEEYFSLARPLFIRAIDGPMPTNEFLPYFNLGILEARIGNYADALELLDRSIELAKDVKEKVACLFVPYLRERRVVFIEEWEPNVVQMLQQAKEVISQYLSQ